MEIDNTKCAITNDIIKVAIKSTSEECELIRDNGQFFEIIAEALLINKEYVVEIVEQEKIKYGK